MRSSLFFVTTALLLSCCSASPVIQGKGKYIIKLKPKASQNVFLGLVDESNRDQLAPVNKVKYRYSPKIFNGFAGEFSNDFIANAAKNPDVEYVEVDGVVKAFGSQANPPSWGLSRIGVRYNNFASANYNYPDSAGEGVTVFVIDTGVVPTHSDFEGRAFYETSFISGENIDGNGHGTHCAGTIASKTYGVAKKAIIRAIQVLSKEGSGSYSGVISGIQYAVDHAVYGTDKSIKTVISMSLGGPKSQAIDDAMNSAVKARVIPVVAAGNENKDASDTSPANVPDVITVGAIGQDDMRASFSNYGPCVDVYAPGVDITSLWKGADGATNKISGTSMATPHVAGIAALYLSSKPYQTVQDLRDDIVKSSNKLKKENASYGEKERRVAYAFPEYSRDTPQEPDRKTPAPSPGPTFPDLCKLFPWMC